MSLKSLFFLFASLSSLYPTEQNNEIIKKTNPLPLQLPQFAFFEFRTAYFYPQGKTFRSVYSAAPIWGLDFTCQIHNNFYAWTSAEYFFKKGKTSSHHSSKLSLVPLSFGLKWLYSSYQWLQPYFGIGSQFLYLLESTSSPFLIHSLDNWDWGIRLKAGFLTQFSNHFFIDFFSDFFFKCARIYKPSHHSVTITNPNVNYFNFGGAVGVVF